MTKIALGRHVYGLAAIAFGVITLLWHGLNIWQQVPTLGKVPYREILVYTAAAIELIGGIAILWPKTVRAGAISLGGLYLTFALFCVPYIVSKPKVYNNWGNFFEQFSLVTGALIAYAMASQSNSGRARIVARIGYIGFAICVVSFTLEQLVYLHETAQFVPKWIPPGQMFWAITTTIAFALAAIALLSGRSALLAARLLTVMLIGFQLLIWLPVPFADPHKMFNWSESAENLAITGVAWIVADFLNQGPS